jgi:tetratricopeptide (TPR) repeat protein
MISRFGIGFGRSTSFTRLLVPAKFHFALINPAKAEDRQYHCLGKCVPKYNLGTRAPGTNDKPLWDWLSRPDVDHKAMKFPAKIALCFAVLGGFLNSPMVFAQDADTPAQPGLTDQQNDDYAQSLENFNQAIASHPEDAKSYYGRAYIYVKLGDDDKAIADLTQAIQLDPRYAQAYYRRSFVYMIHANYDAAGADLTTVIQINPQFKKAYLRRATVELLEGKDDEAIADLDKLIQIDPHFDQAYIRRSFAFMIKGDYAQAITALNQILATNPQAGTYNRLAWLLATCPDANFRDGAKAVENATNACGLTGWKISAQLDTLAAAYAESGDFADAIKWQTEAISLQKAPALLDAQKSRLALYESSHPYHVQKYEPKFEANIL